MLSTLSKNLVLCGLLTTLVIIITGCGDLASKTTYLDPENAPKAGDKGWIPLFNGKDLSGWIIKDKSVPMSWKAVDGMMSNTSSHEHRGSDIYTEQKFKDFEIYYEYRIPKASNSGLYLRGRYEIQILDDDSHPNLRPNQKNGAFYDLMAPKNKITRKAGEWQSVYAKLCGNKVTVILNGMTIFDNAVLARPTRGGLDMKNDPNLPGPILIQGNHGSIDVRNIMIRPIG